MIEFTQYATQFQGFRGRLVGLPSWARFIVGVAALPGILLAVLALLGFLLAVAVLLLLTLPVYSVLKSLTSLSAPRTGAEASVEQVPGPGISSPGVKRVESTIVE